MPVLRPAELQSVGPVAKQYLFHNIALAIFEHLESRSGRCTLPYRYTQRYAHLAPQTVTAAADIVGDIISKCSMPDEAG
jgi:hypothetical protein